MSLEDDWAPTPGFERRIGKIEARTAVLEALQETAAAEMHDLKSEMRMGFRDAAQGQSNGNRLAITNLVALACALLGLVAVLIVSHH